MKRLLTVALAVVPALAAFAVSAESNTVNAKGIESARRFFDSISSGRFSDVYGLLPASYKTDVSTLVSTFGKKMDADLWKECQSLVVDLADLAAVKSGMMAELSTRRVGTELGMTPEQSADLRQQTADVVSKVAPEVKTLASKLTLDVLKTGEIEDILEMPELANIAKVVANTKTAKEEFTLVDVKSGLSGAVIAVIKNGLGQVDNTEFINVEGAWIPQKLADGWKGGVDMALKSINEMKFSESQKQQFLSMVPLVRMGIQQAKTARTPEELGQAFIMPFMMIAMTMRSIGGESDADEDAQVVTPMNARPESPPQATTRQVAPTTSVPSPRRPARPSTSRGVNQVPGSESRTAPQPVMP